MKINIIDWFRRPFPVVDSLKDILIISLGSGTIVLSFLLIFQPFGINSIRGIFVFLCGFGVIDFLVTALNLLLLPRILPSRFKQSQWTIGKNLLAIAWILFTIALVNFIYGEFLVSREYVEGLEQLNRTGILSWIFMTFSVGVIPVICALYFIEKRLGRRNYSLAEEYNKGVSEQQIVKPGSEIVLESGKDTRHVINTSDLICIQAEGGNYASVYWQDDSGLHKETIRLTLVGFLKNPLLGDYIVRCHKSYIINLQKVLSFRGNARSVNVRLEGLNFEVPLSRSFPRALLKKETI